MLSRLIVQGAKPLIQEVAGAAVKRGAPLEGGNYLADVEKNYDGINAEIDPLTVSSDTIAQGSKFNKVVTRKGERYATSELTVGALVEGDALVVTGGKFVAALGGVASEWTYGGEYSNEYGVPMYVVQKNKSAINPLVLSVTTDALPDAQVGVAYSETLAVDYNGADEITYSTASDLPTGVTLSAAGVLAGTPAADMELASPYSIVVVATDGVVSDEVTLSLTVLAAG